MKKLTQKMYNALRKDRTRYLEIENAESKLMSLYDDKQSVVDSIMQQTINCLMIAANMDIDLLETIENYYKGQSIRIWIPIVPPGINATYGVNCKSGQKVYKTKAAKEWEQAAILPIRNAANLNGFLIDKKRDKLSISILIKGSQHDVDAPIKMIIDTVARTLGFDDKIVMSVQSKVRRATDDRGVLIEIEKLND